MYRCRDEFGPGESQSSFSEPEYNVDGANGTTRGLQTCESVRGPRIEGQEAGGGDSDVGSEHGDGFYIVD